MITLDQVRADIKSGKCKAIYMCSKSLWWTHDICDVVDQGETHWKYLNTREKVIRDVNFKQQGIFTSPIAEPIIINKDPKQWLATSERFIKQFGKYRLAALMKAHHQNNSTHFYNKWQRYNDLIDQERKLKVVK